MSLCILAAGKLTTLAATTFMLAWTHSVQKTEWQEDWQVTSAGLTIVEARVQGSGAGMEAGEGAVFDGTWWHYRPAVGTIPKLLLARSGAAGLWRLCVEGACLDFGGEGDPVEISPC